MGFRRSILRALPWAGFFAPSRSTEKGQMKNNISRRALLKGMVATGALTLGGCAAPPTKSKTAPSSFAAAQPNLIRKENQRPGTRDWMLTNTRIDPKTKYRCPWIEGYCSRTSVRAGEKLKIMVSTNPASSFVIDIYRLGYYGGNGGRHMQQLGPLPGKVQPDPDIGHERLRECRW